jgi:GTP-binding protein
MADGVLLLVDAAEGPMPQTRFVLSKAFHHHLTPIVVVNKVDKPEARPAEVVNEVFDLFIDLDCDEKALEFPVLFGSGRQGWMSMDRTSKGGDMTPLLDTILEYIPAPTDDVEGPTQFRVTTLEWSDFVGRIAIGRVHGGRLRRNARYLKVDRDGAGREVDVRGLYTFEGITRREIDCVEAGDLCAVTGVEEILIGESITDVERPAPLPPIAVDEPTMSIVLCVNDSPFAGRDGKFLTSRHLRERLERELRTNVALRVDPGDGPDSFLVSGRGVLHLGVLIENMRREGYEFAVAKPHVIFKDVDGQRTEPIEHLTVDCPEGSTGKVIEIVGERRAELINMQKKGNFQRLEFRVPSRGLIGVRTRLLNATAGEATMHHVFEGYGPHRGTIPERTAGVMISMAPGRATFYALDNLRDRGVFFVEPQTEVFEGMIVGEHCKENDLVVNLCREKKLTNVRSSTKETFVKLLPARLFTVESALEYVGEDELVEITPSSIRLRKMLLNEKDRKRGERQPA